MSTQTKTTKTIKTKAGTAGVITKLPPKPLAFEVLDLVSKQRSNAKKVEILKEYEHDSLKAIFIWNFDESVISMLPPGDVPYFGDDNPETSTMTERINQAVSSMKELGTNSVGVSDKLHTTIRVEYAKFYNFIKGGNDGLSILRRENIFINLLQGLHPLEAEILCLVKDKRLQDKYNITKDIVSEAYPDITWGGRS
jgi:hypothetical protein